MSTWLVVIGCAAATYALRASMVLALASRPLPAWLERHLGAVGPSVLGALVAYGSFVRHGHAAFDEPEVGLGVLAAVLVVARTRRPLHALVAGLPVVWLVAVVVKS